MVRFPFVLASMLFSCCINAVKTQLRKAQIVERGRTDFQQDDESNPLIQQTLRAI